MLKVDDYAKLGARVAGAIEASLVALDCGVISNDQAQRIAGETAMKVYKELEAKNESN